MGDPRYHQLAELLVGYSCALRRGETVLIEAIDAPDAFVRALIRATDRRGGRPLVTLKSYAVWRDLILCASEEQMRLMGKVEALRMSEVDAYVGVRASPNISEWSDIPREKMDLYQRLCWKPAHGELRVPKTRWVVLRWPSPSMAQQAQMSTEGFEDFYFRVCTMDYERMSEAMQPLRELMERTRSVRLLAPGTDLRFSIEGMPAVACDGHRNIPDGEVFTAPVRHSAEGTIAFNTPTIYEGVTHENVRLRFREGAIIEATSSAPAHLDQILGTDEGSRYLGEFSIAFNPHIRRPMKDILFDEKMAGSVHLTPGNAYDETPNGNRSLIHWDMVLAMTPELGGGEIHFDGRPIRQDGRFLLPELEPLNPEALLA